MEDWWHAFYCSAFDNLIVRPKWKHQHRNARVGDLVLLRPLGKVAVGEYKRGMIVEVIEDADGLVRNVMVKLYKHDRRRQVDSYHGEGHVVVRMAIQRVIILLAVEEQLVDEEDTRAQARGADNDQLESVGQQFAAADIEEIA